MRKWSIIDKRNLCYLCYVTNFIQDSLFSINEGPAYEILVRLIPHLDTGVVHNIRLLDNHLSAWFIDIALKLFNFILFPLLPFFKSLVWLDCDLNSRELPWTPVLVASALSLHYQSVTIIVPLSSNLSIDFRWSTNVSVYSCFLDQLSNKLITIFKI